MGQGSSRGHGRLVSGSGSSAEACSVGRESLVHNTVHCRRLSSQLRERTQRAKELGQEDEENERQGRRN